MRHEAAAGSARVKPASWKNLITPTASAAAVSRNQRFR